SAAGYTAPKIDVRGGVFDQEGRVLLVREIADGNRWTLPGGWCDVLETPRQAVEREVEEEAGFAVRAVHLAAVIDREQWPHEPAYDRSEEHTSELQSRFDLVCRLLLEKKHSTEGRSP